MPKKLMQKINWKLEERVKNRDSDNTLLSFLHNLRDVFLYDNIEESLLAHIPVMLYNKARRDNFKL